jgi:hypothetical protein
VPADVVNGDGKVMLGLKDGVKLIVKGWDPDDNKKKLPQVELDAQKFLGYSYGWGKSADHYEHGKMYYYVPIRHNRNDNEDNLSVGDVGIVRNHWYKIAVNSVLQPGISVDNPDQPIIPNTDPADKYLGLEIHLLPWHVVEQTVDLQ